MRLLFQRDMTPHPQYTAFYKFLEGAPMGDETGGFGADVVVHFGMHGTEEWLPGTPLGNTGDCWPDQLTGGLPNVYVYAANNPSESLLAKRRGYGTLVSHNVPPYSRAGLYKDLLALRRLLADFYEDMGRRVADGGLAPAPSSALPGSVAVEMTSPSSLAEPGAAGSAAAAAEQGDAGAAAAAAPTTEGALLQTLFSAGLDQDCPLPPSGLKALEAAGGVAGGEAAAEAAAAAMTAAGELDPYLEGLRQYLGQLEQRLFSAGLHTFGRPPPPDEMLTYLEAYLADGAWRPAGAKPSDPSSAPTANQAEAAIGESLVLPSSVIRAIADGEAEADVLQALPDRLRAAGHVDDLSEAGAAVRAACLVRDLLLRNTEELDGAMRGLNGEYVPPAPGGDLLRDGPGVLPTGRNIHALDPYRIPSPVALARGRAAAEATLEMQRKEAGGAFPETVAVNLWGLEAIKTRGESVAVVMALVGAEPVIEATGRVVRYELIPLEKLGRPRVDVLTSLSGIFRDSFANVVDLLDDLMVRAAAADEPTELNFVRKHALEMRASGLSQEDSTARIFSNPAGEFGSMVNERVSDSSWESADDLGETWAQRNAFSFGRNRRGVNARSTLDALMKTTSQVVQCIDSVEYGLTDIQEYYANTGAMARAMDVAQGGQGKVQVAVVESYAKTPRPKKLNDVLRLEYRSKLLNPKWANLMVDQGSGGAFEVSQRMTALIGWAATTKFQEDWVFTQSAETYAMDPVMAEKLRQANPEAFKNVVGRLLEAKNRGMWKASPDMLNALQELYSDMDDRIEFGTAASSDSAPAP